MERTSEGIGKKVIGSINNFGRNKLKKIYVHTWYSWFWKRTGNTASNIKWKPITKSRRGQLKIPSYMITMDSDYMGSKYTSASPLNPNVRQWIRKAWQIKRTRYGLEWRATRKPKKMPYTLSSRVRYQARAAGKINPKSFLKVTRKPWISEVDIKMRYEFKKNLPIQTGNAIKAAFKGSGWY